MVANLRSNVLTLPSGNTRFVGPIKKDLPRQLFALLALIFLNPPLVLNHLVQYERIVNVPLCR